MKHGENGSSPGWSAQRHSRLRPFFLFAAALVAPPGRLTALLLLRVADVSFGSPDPDAGLPLVSAAGRSGPAFEGPPVLTILLPSFSFVLVDSLDAGAAVVGGIGSVPFVEGESCRGSDVDSTTESKAEADPDFDRGLEVDAIGCDETALSSGEDTVGWDGGDGFVEGGAELVGAMGIEDEGIEELGVALDDEVVVAEVDATEGRSNSGGRVRGVACTLVMIRACLQYPS